MWTRVALQKTEVIDVSQKYISLLHRPNIQFKTLCSVSVFDCKLVRDGPKHSFDGLEPRFGDKFDRCDCSTWVSFN